MKQLVLASFMVCITAIASAQTTGGSGNSSTSSSSSTNRNSSQTKKGKSSKQTVQQNNRKEYEGKNGQQATPTGHEATSVNGGYAAIGKDTTSKPPARKKNHQ
jgi:hypothetical protein